MSLALYDQIRAHLVALAQAPTPVSDPGQAGPLLERCAALGRAQASGAASQAEVRAFFREMAPYLTFQTVARISWQLRRLERVLFEFPEDPAAWEQICTQRSGLQVLLDSTEGWDAGEVLASYATPEGLDDAMERASTTRSLRIQIPSGTPEGHRWWWLVHA